MVKRTGVYQPCTGWKGCGGRGWVRGPGGSKQTHVRCRGDGWIRVGAAPGGAGGRGRRSGGAAGKRLRKVGNDAAAGSVVWLLSGALFGTVGFVVAGLVLALVAFLAVHRALVAAR